MRDFENETNMDCCKPDNDAYYIVFPDFIGYRYTKCNNQCPQKSRKFFDRLI